MELMNLFYGVPENGPENWLTDSISMDILMRENLAGKRGTTDIDFALGVSYRCGS